MCTLTWFVSDDGYQLFFNRDERLTRRRALLPTLHSHGEKSNSAVHEFSKTASENGLCYISPTDADAGGTWIASNEYGVTVCLLNHYQFQQIETYKNWTSRGEIVRQFSQFTDLSDAERFFMQLNLDDYRAFRMFIIEPSGQNRLLVWDGHSARVETNVKGPKSSSSVDAKHVKAFRKRVYKDQKIGSSSLSADYINYHSSHIPSASKESVCMHRDDAKTVSLSHIIVSQNEVNFSYADGSPCEVPLSEPVSMPLKPLYKESPVKTVMHSV